MTATELMWHLIFGFGGLALAAVLILTAQAIGRWRE